MVLSGGGTSQYSQSPRVPTVQHTSWVLRRSLLEADLDICDATHP